MTHSDDTTRELRAIETRYHGYRFRSRLEARWAVFFDTLTIGYRYEDQGFLLHCGTRYLCDFEVPEWAAWVEIKSESAEIESALSKLKQLGEATNHAALLIAGAPWPGDYRVTFKTPAAAEWASDMQFRGCFGCTSLWIGNDNDVRHLGGSVPGGAYANETCRLSVQEGWPLNHTRGMLNGLTDRLDLAFRRARGARFEFGESGG